MNCPKCGSWSSVNETRAAPFLMVRRLRECPYGHRFTTYEMHAAVMCSAKQRAKVYAETVRKRVAQWTRDMRIRKLHKVGVHWSELQERFKLSKSSVFNAIKRK